MQSWGFHKLRSVLLLAGAFTFAFLLGEAAHELGHYLAHRAYGHTGVAIHLDPFGGSRIVGAASGPRNAMGVTSAAGPLLNLALGAACSLSLWRRRRPALLPGALWGPVAMVQEGVTFSLGMLTPGGDAAWIVAWGVPGGIVVGVGIGLLSAGTVATSWLCSQTVLGRDEPWWTRFLIVLAGISPLMLIRAVYSSVAAPGMAMENLIPLILAVLLSLVIATLHQPLTAVLRSEPERASAVPWPAVLPAMALGAAVFWLQVIASIG